MARRSDIEGCARNPSGLGWRGKPFGSGRQAARDLIATQIAATDRQIDALVYELYGLTEAEIAVVEGAN